MVPRAVLLPKAVSVEIEQRSKENVPNEAGGFLIGMFKGAAIEITGLTGPYAGDASRPHKYTRSDPLHKEVIINDWRKSGKLRTLVGDWHSHPGASAKPSSIDMRTWIAMSKLQDRNMVGAILGSDGLRLYWQQFGGLQALSMDVTFRNGDFTIWEPIMK